jgi:RimJ/RimL family protein N-acetyltransferase
MTAIELRTERLLLRPWREDDVEPMDEINRKPEVTEFLNQRNTKRALRQFHLWMGSHWERFGFGPLAVEGCAGDLTGRVLGFAGLAYPEFLPQVAEQLELGWRLDSAVWGQGIATEAASAVRDDAFGRMGLPELISLIDPRNVRSRRVAEKLGMIAGESFVNPVQGNVVEIWHVGGVTDDICSARVDALAARPAGPAAARGGKGAGHRSSPA